MKSWISCKDEAERIYSKRVRDEDENDSEKFPICISLGVIKAGELLADRTIWRELEGSISDIDGVMIQTITRETRKYGTQTLPKYLEFENWNALLAFIGKEDEYQDYLKLETYILGRIPNLKAWVRSHWEEVLEYRQDWDSILEVVQYFLNNDTTNLDVHLREIPISVHTKFIESHSKVLKKILDHILPPELIDWEESGFSLRYRLKPQEETIRFRILDEEIRREVFLGWEDIGIRLSDFSKKFPHGIVKNVFIIENLTSFLSFPSKEESIAIFGKGFQVAMLRDVDWLQEKNIYYWGDMDIQGFQILSMFRSYFSHTKSLLMDQSTWEKHRDYIVEGSSSPNITDTFLTKEEKDFCKNLKINNGNSSSNAQKFLRLEQEKIPISYVAQRIKDY